MSSLAIPYVAIRLMEDIGLCDGGNIKLLPLVEFMHEGTVIVATTVLFLPINRDFYVLFK